MNQVATLTIAAQDEDDFDDLVARASALSKQVAKFERSNAGRTMTYQAAVVIRFEGNPETLVVTIDFDAAALNILGVNLNGRDALSLAEAATKH